MTLQAGDVVLLKSGGQKMTVENIEDDLVFCVWFNDKKVERSSFDLVTLKAYAPSSVTSVSF